MLQWSAGSNVIFTNIIIVLISRELGYSSGVATLYSTYGTHLGDVFAMDDVGCLGTETSILDCSHTTVDDCANTEAAGVVCTRGNIYLLGRVQKVLILAPRGQKRHHYWPPTAIFLLTD